MNEDKKNPKKPDKSPYDRAQIEEEQKALRKSIEEMKRLTAKNDEILRRDRPRDAERTSSQADADPRVMHALNHHPGGSFDIKTRRRNKP